MNLYAFIGLLVVLFVGMFPMAMAGFEGMAQLMLAVITMLLVVRIIKSKWQPVVKGIVSALLIVFCIYSTMTISGSVKSFIPVI